MIAGTVRRLAVLLAAGIPPLAAWRYLDAPDAAPAVRAAAAAATDGIADAVDAAAGAGPDEIAWRCTAAAWRVATDAGAPLSPALLRLADVLADLEENRREVGIALAGPRATARIVVALPLLGLGLGTLLGFDTLPVLVGTPAGIACLAIGAALLVAGRRWTRRLLLASASTDPTPGLALDLLAIAVSGGASLERARETCESALARHGLPPLGDSADRVLELARAAGVPIAALLGGEATELRRDAHAAIRRRTAELSTRLLLPLGVCLLPAFLVLGVVPLLIAVVRSTAALA